MPVSCTAIRTSPSSPRAARSRISPPVGVYLAALSARMRMGLLEHIPIRCVGNGFRRLQKPDMVGVDHLRFLEDLPGEVGEIQGGGI